MKQDLAEVRLMLAAYGAMQQRNGQRNGRRLDHRDSSRAPQLQVEIS